MFHTLCISHFLNKEVKFFQQAVKQKDLYTSYGVGVFYVLKFL